MIPGAPFSPESPSPEALATLKETALKKLTEFLARNPNSLLENRQPIQHAVEASPGGQPS